MLEEGRCGLLGRVSCRLRLPHSDRPLVTYMNTPSEPIARRYRLSVAQYHAMAETGVLAHARVELVEGELIDMAPIGSRHAYVVNQLTRLLSLAAEGRAVVAVQQPVQLPPRSEPQPDLSLLRGTAARYRNSHPQASGVVLVIEVSDTTLRYDRDIKVPLYARHGIPEVWLIDVNTAQLWCMRQPQQEGYASISRVASGRIDVAGLPGVGIDVAEVLEG